MRDKEYSAYMLLNAPGFGAKSIFYVYDNLIRLGLNVNDLFDKSLSELENYLPEIGHGKFSRASLSFLQSLDDDKLFTSYQKLKSEKIFIIGLDDERYPKILTDKLGENAPPVLFCKGYLPLLNSESISIVGSRDVSDFAVMLTKRIAGRLAGNGYNVTSGFAKGVDTNAHIGALENNGTFDAGLTALKHKIPLFVLNPSLLSPAPQGNIDLLKIGGISLSNGNELVQYLEKLNGYNIAIDQNKQESPMQVVEEPAAVHTTKNDIKETILNLINGRALSINEILEQAHLDWTTQKLSTYLNKMDEIEVLKRSK
jgi:predicted Rossmann fold nucleotide-binding protein DprA/Smf involved in DNA uptake